MAKDPGRVLIFDTTLRDGEQSPGASLNLEEKLAIAQQLARLGVDVIEAGFPFASPGDFAAVQRIAQQVGGDNGPIICGLARASRADIKACADAVAPAPHRRIHTKPRQLLGNGQLFLQVEARPGRLLTIPQGGVKNQDATGVLGHGRGSSGGLSRSDYELTHPSSAPGMESD